jgi:UDP-N-acetylmuramate--alanine ligase
MKLHFIGIGGIGMSALASIYLTKGHRITGSDLRLNNLTRRLSDKGAVIYQGHSARNISKDTDLVIKSSCIREDNPEIRQARRLRLSIIPRGEMLKRVIEQTPLSIAVTGTHGKTTTSALISHIVNYCGKNPTVIVGGEIKYFNSNARTGSDEVVVAEVDESDGYFRNINTAYAVVTNIEEEHMENYGSFDNLKASYREFIGRISPHGCFVFNGEDRILTDLATAASIPKATFGINGKFEIKCENYSYARAIAFNLISRGKDYGRISSSLIGRHNLMNILGAAAVCLEVGFDFKQVAEAVSLFNGVKRRFDRIGKVGNIEVIEDYAHHPTELKAVITAAKDYSKGRVIAVFQPHRYSRTRDLAEEFSNCFYGANVLILTDIYSANEDKIEDVSIENIYEKIDKNRFQRLELAKKADIPGLISGIVRDDDLVLVLGAGDISDVSGDIVEKIKEVREIKSETV